MKLLGAPAAALSLAGRHGTLVAAASVFVGLAIPGLAAACKPYLGEAIVVMLTLIPAMTSAQDLVTPDGVEASAPRRDHSARRRFSGHRRDRATARRLGDRP